MKKFLLFLFAAVSLTVWADDIVISTPNTSLLLTADEGDVPRFLYYGPRLTAAEAAQFRATGAAERTVYPVFGIECMGETALQVCHADGNLSLDMAVTSIDSEETPDASLTYITLRDKVYPFQVKLCYKAMKQSDVIETWTEISHQEKKAVRLQRFDSAYLPIRKNQVWLRHLHGTWSNEAKVTDEPLAPGMKVIKNKDGLRNAHTAHEEGMISLDGTPGARAGRGLGAARCWSGNYELRFDTDDSNYHHFFAGINPDTSERLLAPREVFVTPELALTYSAEGVGGASRNFHRWARLGKLHNGTALRDILLNSWEGVYFGINEEGMDQMMQDIAEMGGELFVMDDGWFATKYQRNNDSYALGDWTVDPQKLPNGIAHLTETAKRLGIKFGIWLEPEMTNTLSELYEKHPNWIVCQNNREPRPGRGGTQLVLDCSNPAVQDFIFETIDRLMTENPDIAYIKWDANANINNYGSRYLTSDRLSHLYVVYHLGLRAVLERIRAKYPDLTIQDCASGGGRANYGLLPYFDEFWVSDDTDPLQRLYMQWGTSLFFPAVAMGQHVSASPNHNSKRATPLKFRFDVAMTGRFGLELQPKDMTDEEKSFSRQCIADYKLIRPIVQQGDLYRLISPYDDRGVSSLMYVSPDKEEAVFFAYKIFHYMYQILPRFTMDGLDPEKHYRLTELNLAGDPIAVDGQVLSGKTLMEHGIELPLQWEYSSRVLKLTAVEQK